MHIMSLVIDRSKLITKASLLAGIGFACGTVTPRLGLKPLRPFGFHL